VLAIFLVVFFVIFFWAAYEQAGSSMNLFADKNTDLTAPGCCAASPAATDAGELVPERQPARAASRRRRSSPALAAPRPRRPRAVDGDEDGRRPRPARRRLRVHGARRPQRRGGALVSPWWLVAAYAFHTWGELCLSPVGLSYVTKVAPLQFASLMMGVWFLANAAANKVAGTLAAQVEAWGNTKLYTVLVGSSLAAAAIMLLCVPLLKRLTRTVRA
jgi:POT family proton-dependent oligopeptide transporter